VASVPFVAEAEAIAQLAVAFDLYLDCSPRVVIPFRSAVVDSAVSIVGKSVALAAAAVVELCY